MIKSFSHFVISLALLSPFNAFAAYEKPYTGEMKTHVARGEDTLVHVARDYDLGFVEMRAANPYVDLWLPGEGTKLLIPARHILPDAPREGVVINLPEMRLFAFVNGDDEPSTFPIGVGREGLGTPLGETTVARKKAGPSWRPTPRMRAADPDLPEVIKPGPDNPLGTHAIYLDWPSYAIHGTNRPFGIGRRVSSGCIRMYPENIKTLFEMIPVGTKVTVVNQPIKLAWINNELYLEAHPDVEQAIQMEENGAVVSHKLREEDLKRIISVAGDQQAALDWTLIRNIVRERRGYPIEIGKRIVASDVKTEEVAASSAQSVDENDKSLKAPSSKALNQ